MKTAGNILMPAGLGAFLIAGCAMDSPEPYCYIAVGTSLAGIIITYVGYRSEERCRKEKSLHVGCLPWLWQSVITSVQKNLELSGRRIRKHRKVRWWKKRKVAPVQQAITGKEGIKMKKEEFNALAEDMYPLIGRMQEILREHGAAGMAHAAVCGDGYFHFHTTEKEWYCTRLDEEDIARIRSTDPNVDDEICYMEGMEV